MTTQTWRDDETGAYARYAYAGLLLALIAAEVLFALGWFLNGTLTARFAARWGAPLAVGWLLHLLISVVEQHLWRAKSVLLWLDLDHLWVVMWPGVYGCIFVVGLLDTGSSGFELLSIAQGYGAPVGGGWALTGALATLCTIAGQLVAIGSEPLLVANGVLIYSLAREWRRYV